MSPRAGQTPSGRSGAELRIWHPQTCCHLLVVLLGLSYGSGVNGQTFQNFASCPSGWTQTSNGGCHLLVKNSSRVSWDVAEQHCVNEGGHLASASTLGEWQDINATCAGSAQTDCWFGVRQLADQALPSAGWYWQDCMAQNSVSWDLMNRKSVVRWRGVETGVASTAEPNDYNSADGSYGVERNNENCAKWQNGQILDYACSSVLPISPTAYVCSKSRYCGINATSVSSGSGSSATCSCACLPGFAGDGQNCRPCDPNATPVTSKSASAAETSASCLCRSPYVGNGFTCQLSGSANLSLAFPSPPRNVCSTSLVSSAPAGNIVYNDFSSGIPFNWFCPFCSGGLTNQTDSTGTYVVASAAARGGRVDAAVGVQVNNLQANQSHYFSAWVRTRNAVNQTNRGVIIFGSNTLAAGSFQGGPFCMAPVALIQNDCWSLIMGAFTPPTSSQMIRIGVADTSADIHVHGVSVVPRSTSDIIKAQNASIDQWRKAPLQLSFRRNGAPVAGTFDLELVRAGFPWGIQDLDTKVVTDSALQNFVFNTFKASAVAQGLSGWITDEPAPNTLNYAGNEPFIAWVQSSNLSLWGPQIVWDDLNNGIPQWVQQQVAAGGNLDALIAQRAIRAMNAADGRYVTVTVDNEGIHNTYIPRNANGIDSIVEMFTTVRSADLAIGHNTPITFNEYNVGESCYYNFPLQNGGDPVSPDNYIDRINFLNAQGAGQLVNVAGLQFQITPNENEAQRMSIGIDYIHNRTGLPIQVTEFNVNVGFGNGYPFDRTYQANIVETSLRQLFANRHVSAIMFQHMVPYPWGGDSDATCGPCMFASDTYAPNAAGQRYLKLRDEWTTRVTDGAVSSQGSAAPMRVFHGTYKVTLKDSNGNASPSQTITVYNDNGANTTQAFVVNV